MRPTRADADLLNPEALLGIEPAIPAVLVPCFTEIQTKHSETRSWLVKIVIFDILSPFLRIKILKFSGSNFKREYFLIFTCSVVAN